MTSSFKQKIPLLFLVSICCWWGFYYNSYSPLNDFGAANFEWLFLLDGFLMLPILCFFCIKNKKEAGIKAVVYSCLVILVGSYIIPEQNKLIWNYLESGRYLVLAIFLFFELSAVLTVYLAIRIALYQKTDPDLAIQKPIKNFLGDGSLSKVFTFETRMWTYLFFANRIKPNYFNGQQHFSYHQKDDAQSNALGFIFLILFEIPLVHIILHFIWSPLAANIATALTLFGLAFFIAEYRAMSRRPISITSNELVIRYGIFNSLNISLNNIKSVKLNSKRIRRNPSIKRYDLYGTPNIEVQLHNPVGKIEAVYLGIDKPNQLINGIEIQKNSF